MTQDTADDYKAVGNKYYQQQKYNDAIDAYTKAIGKNPSVPIFFTNRALCYIQIKNYTLATADCRKAAELDSNSVKAFYFWGRASTLLENYDEAIKHLARAIELANKQKVNYGDEIAGQMRIARREKFRSEEDKRIMQEVQLHSYLEGLIEQDLARKMFEMNADDEATESAKERLQQEAQGYKAQLNNLLSQVEERRRRREIPDYLCGKISFELLRDPVITPSGITYDRADIKQHLQRVGHFDPVTRTPLKEDDLIPNLAMKEVIENFVNENPWAEHEDLLN